MVTSALQENSPLWRSATVYPWVRREQRSSAETCSPFAASTLSALCCAVLCARQNFALVCPATGDSEPKDEVRGDSSTESLSPQNQQTTTTPSMHVSLSTPLPTTSKTERTETKRTTAVVRLSAECWKANLNGSANLDFGRVESDIHDQIGRDGRHGALKTICDRGATTRLCRAAWMDSKARIVELQSSAERCVNVLVATNFEPFVKNLSAFVV